MAVLLSPVAWIHHLHWMVVVVFAVLGADPLRDRRRLLAAGVGDGLLPVPAAVVGDHLAQPPGLAASCRGGCCRTPTPSAR